MRVLRRPTATLLLAVQVTACSSYRSSRLAPERAVQEQSKVKVRLTGGEEVELKEPWVRGDSIGGLRDVWSGESQRWLPSAWGVPVDSVEVLETRQTNTWKTVGVVWLAAGAVAMVILAASGPWFPENLGQ